MPQAEPLILIVEDDVNDQTFIQRALKRSGVANRITIVDDGAAASAYIRGEGAYTDRAQHPLPGLVITDLKMPRMGGIEFLRWMSEQPQFKLIPTLVLTSSSDQADITAAFAHGAKGYMIKPVQFGELEKLMRVIVEYWRRSCVPLLPANAQA